MKELNVDKDWKIDLGDKMKEGELKELLKDCDADKD